MTKKKTWLIILALIAAFFLWRFVRPMNIFVVDERFERPMQIEMPLGIESWSAKACGKCHREIYNEWAESMHGQAWTDPYFQVDSRFDGSQQICLNCHTPLVNQQQSLVLGFRDRDKFDPVLAPNPEYDAALRDEGVTCAVCHIRNGRIVGPFRTERAPHAVEYDPGMSRGMKPCLRCHVVMGKRWDTFYAMPPCGTVAEIEKGGHEVDCIGCHMPVVVRPAAAETTAREGRRHQFQGGHAPELVKQALRVEHKLEAGELVVTLTNTGASHYLPTGTPDRHLTLELRLLGSSGQVLAEKVCTMKRYILWRPFIVDLRDTRLPYGQWREFGFSVIKRGSDTPAVVDVTVRYHFLDEARRKKIGYNNVEPISYPIFHEQVPLGGLH
ncbi:MAG TPA: multiheme c-type cytochrome [Nitrospirota bacterium]|nr:multiheme c-type cytochrome [Nitrospirota bacterium]